jgi:hypothetical protein
MYYEKMDEFHQPLGWSTHTFLWFAGYLNFSNLLDPKNGAQHIMFSLDIFLQF